jgi:hypothetical protein
MQLTLSNKVEAVKAGFKGPCHQELYALAPAGGAVTALSLTVDALEQARLFAKRSMNGDNSCQARSCCSCCTSPGYLSWIFSLLPSLNLPHLAAMNVSS